ncbi:glycosyltransferase family 4 protein [Agrobacterium tumefaciens]|uniref:glycosyltransferase family 4 protein n=1 Tax=Agrobacterium tumefaciens TaxID=358 RepID=UPI003BA0EB69
MIFLNRYGFPDQSATSRMISSIAFSLAQRGMNVTVVASREIHNHPGSVLPATETVRGVQIQRLASGRFGRHSLVRRSIDYLLFQVLAFVWLLRNVGATDMVVVCTDPPLLSVTSGIAIRLKGACMVNWIMDLFPETAIELGFFRKRARWLAAWLTLARNWSLRSPAMVVCPTDKMAEFLFKQGLTEDRISVLHHWSDGEEIYPVSPRDNSLRKAWGLQDKFVVGYSGNFGRAHEFGTMLAAAKRLEHRPDIRFLLIGGGHQHAGVMAAVQGLGLQNIIFKPLQPVENLAESLSVADVHLVSLLPELEHCIIPSKFYGILAAGRPTIFVGDPDGEVPRVLKAKGCGSSVEISETDKLAAIIENLCDDPETLKAMGDAARRLLCAEYSREKAADAWAALIAGLQTVEPYSPPIAQGIAP